jgi:hypothetical protein
MYEEFIEHTLIRLCSKPRTFEYVSRNLYGLDPTVVQEYLINLEKTGQLKRVNELWVQKKYEKRRQKIKKLDEIQHAEFLKKHIPYFDLYKKPHPLDFEWRNSSKTLHYLCELLQHINTSSDKLLLLGMPSLFVSTYLTNLTNSATLIDNNTTLLTSIRQLTKKSKSHYIIEGDIFNINPQKIGRYNSVFMDPPWYPDHFFQFIWLACECLEVGGVLGISLPPLNTRPGIDKERMEWFLYCQQHGLCIESIVSQRMEYVMPFFEFNAFRASGIKNIAPFWRKGDLALFRKIEEKKSVRPKSITTFNDWVEKEIDIVRFRVKKTYNGKNQQQNFLIKHLIPGDILPSVSSRHPKRKSVNIWTSGNRVFQTSNPELFLRLLDVYKYSKSNNTKEFKIVADFVRIVVDLEKKEYNNYLDWLYYEMEKRTY